MTEKLVTIGSWERPEKLPRCGSFMAHGVCRFGSSMSQNMDCTAPPEAYDACPYRQEGGTVAVFTDLKEEDQ